MSAAAAAASIQPTPVDEKALQQATSALSRIHWIHVAKAASDDPVTYLKFAELVNVFSSYFKTHAEKVLTVKIRQQLRDGLPWYDHLSELSHFGLPVGQICSSVWAIISSATVTFVCGDKRTFSICGVEFDDSVETGITWKKGTGLSVRELRRELKMPEVPLSILMDLVMQIARFGRNGDRAALHFLTDTVSVKESMTQMLAKALTCGDEKDESPLLFANPQSLEFYKANKRVKQQAYQWTLLMPGKTTLLTEPDLEVAKYQALYTSTTVPTPSASTASAPH